MLLLKSILFEIGNRVINAILSIKPQTLLFLILTALNLTGFSQKKLQFENKVYESSIHSVRLYPTTGETNSAIKPSITLLQEQRLLLEFDDLADGRVNYYARLIHCNYDWTPSSLRDLDFAVEYNETVISDYTYSNTNSQPYVHYQFPIPKVKIPGNYVLVVYKDGNKDDLAFSRRFMVVENRVGLVKDSNSSGTLTLRSTNQQINFAVDYRGVQILNPLQNIHVVVRQNQRWDNARMDIKPSFVRENIQQIEYRLFGEDKYFNAGNEFRFVDFRSLNFPGQNTGRLDQSKNPPQLWIQKDKSRSIDSYAQYPDINGNYFIENRDYGSGEISGNYLLTTFTLQASELSDAEVYVIGEFNDWKRTAENKMTYNRNSQTYEVTLLLKQGWYNYQYFVKSEKYLPNHFEGNHYQTENMYDVMVYYRPFQPNADLLIGYFTIPVNQR